MAVTFKDIDLLTQKSAVAGTEKLEVSDTEYITPEQIIAPLYNAVSQINGVIEQIYTSLVDSALAENDVVRPIYTLNSGYVKNDGTIGSNNDYSYTSPIALAKGQTIHVKTEGYLFSPISKDGSPFVSVIYVPTNPGNGVQADYSYTATEDVSVICCARTDHPYEFYINVKPAINLPFWQITYNLTNVYSSSQLSGVLKGQMYETQLRPDELYVLDSVSVMMGGVDVTSEVYLNGVISIPSVIGEVIINATAITYIQTGLVFQLDGLVKGDANNAWTDLIGKYVFNNYGAESVDNGWYFDGDGFLRCATVLAEQYSLADCTLEVAFDSELPATGYFMFVAGPNLVFNYTHNYQNKNLYIGRGNSGSYSYGAVTEIAEGNGGGKKLVAITNLQGCVNGTSTNRLGVYYSPGASLPTVGRRDPIDYPPMPFKGTVYAIRIYNSVLDLQSSQYNQRIDNQRFNLGLNI